MIETCILDCMKLAEYVSRIFHKSDSLIVYNKDYKLFTARNAMNYLMLFTFTLNRQYQLVLFLCIILLRCFTSQGTELKQRVNAQWQMLKACQILYIPSIVLGNNLFY